MKESLPLGFFDMVDDPNKAELIDDTTPIDCTLSFGKTELIDEPSYVCKDDLENREIEQICLKQQ